MKGQLMLDGMGTAAPAAQTALTASDLRISVIIPLFNGSKYIRETLMSVLGQTHPADEIIVVDDGSTDEGPAIVEDLRSAGPILLYKQENNGQSAARNAGVKLSSGDLIAFLDQDDVWYPDHLAVLLKPFLKERRRQLGWVYSNLDEIDEAGGMVLHSCLNALPFHHPKTDLFECLRQDMFVVPSSTLVLKTALLAVGGFDERLLGYEDDDLFLRLFRCGYDNVFVNVSLTKWRIHTDSCSFSPRMSNSRGIYLRKLIEEFPDDPYRGRIITRDYLAPRFFPHAVRDTLWLLRLALLMRSDEPPASCNSPPDCTIHESRGLLRFLCLYCAVLGPRWPR